ncbi:S24 family peptidase [Hyphomonadaceae bacterium BL14]|nr:S24 family peptidase [Hyphomonadaceae bacterium BL14]
MELDPIRIRVLNLIEDKGTDLKNASLAIGRNAAYLHQYIYRGSPKVLPEDVREGLAELFGVSEDSLRNARRLPRRAGHGEREPRRAARRELVYPEGFSPIAEIDVRASAGPGAINEGLEEASETWLLPDPLIRHEFRARAADLRMITIDGDSMEPVLSSGDRILIDTSQRIPVPPGIFVVWDGMGLVAKRVEHIAHSEPPRVIIHSVNPEYRTYERDAEEVNIVGRVIWAARRL